MKNIQAVLATYGAVSKLAGVLRHNSVVFDPARRENVAEHSYSLAVLAGAVAADLNNGLDIGKVVQFAVVHDLVEAFMEEGDISVYAPAAARRAKKSAEQTGLKRLEKAVAHSWVTETIQAYERQDTAEAQFVYALDKLVVHMNVILNDQHHARPTFAGYLKTEVTARKKIAGAYPELLPYFDLCRIFREKPHLFSAK